MDGDNSMCQIMSKLKRGQVSCKAFQKEGGYSVFREGRP